jgi:hypothetical protein
MAYRNRKRRAPSSLDWTPVADSDELPPLPNIHIRHTHLNLDPTGSSTSRTSYISAPASPSKTSNVASSQDTHDSYNWNTEPAPLEINYENYPFLDPAYQHHLDDSGPDPPQRRKRTPEACILNLNEYMPTNDHSRTIPSGIGCQTVICTFVNCCVWTDVV